MIIRDVGVMMTEENGLKELLALKKALILNVKDPMPGRWRLRMSSSGLHSIRVTGLSSLDFAHGFTRHPTRDFLQSDVQPIKGRWILY